jgi:4-hydroxybenzoate polyprenyltransferase
VSPHGGLVLAMLLGLTAFVLVMQHLHVQLLLLLLGIYLALNLAYTFKLKQVPVVDVFMISGGFLLRLLAGTLAVGITPSRWLLLTGLFLALFLGFSKRKSESLRAADQQRQVLQSYTPALLDVLISAALTATLTTYSLYAISPEVQALHGERLMYTVPLVVFSMFRYCFLVQQGHGEDVSKDLFKDPWILGAGLVWVLLFTGPKF